jgi:hypothetical protein
MDEDLPVIFLGDNHGDWNELFFRIRKRDIKDCYLISVGDCGIGFLPKQRQLQQINMLHEDFEERNIYFKAIRGNHDDPAYFTGDDRICLEHFELIEDYSTFVYNDQTIQFIGGAVSIDRKGRQQGVSYWKDEAVVLNKEACKEVDILVTHTAPSFCFPQQFNEMVYSWAAEDGRLLKDLIDERALMDEIFNLCKPKVHLYGHFHSSWSETLNGCNHRLLNIDELWELKA